MIGLKNRTNRYRPVQINSVFSCLLNKLVTARSFLAMNHFSKLEIGQLAKIFGIKINQNEEKEESLFESCMNFEFMSDSLVSILLYLSKEKTFFKIGFVSENSQMRMESGKMSLELVMVGGVRYLSETI
ncbi:hypothetical protein BpHYR1_001729 [Brachionus plicatilis]|uniref:Uncharacterized protein n=1 Tax=Brachionus plicatilis TaxID=10195 RepID=A0A3M7PXX0_BRAPC|nr:hypothetical protein BpHYR1_001729 [Brachionus plicatilis]